MAEQQVTTKSDAHLGSPPGTEQVRSVAELLEQIAQHWTALNTALDALSPTALTTIQDAQGWSVKDHLIHIRSWERSALCLLQRKPRHLALEVDEALYLQGGEDAINAAIFQKHQDEPLAEVLASFRANHQQLLAALQPLTDADLQKRYRFYLPQEPGEGDGPLAFTIVYNNTAHHYAEHLAWIEALVRQTN